MEAPLPGTGVFIDFFGPRRPGVFFCTHCHCDHLRGLTSGWRRGLLHCSHTTAALLVHRGLCNARCLRPHALEEPFTISDPVSGELEATFVDAGHCPGSVMVVILGVPGGPILNTGDFRYHDGLLQSSTLKHLAAGGERIQRLCLDMSCTNVASLPLKGESVNNLLDVLDKHEGDRVFLHSHGLGDEELLTAVADHYLDTKLMFADKRRFDELQVADPSLHSRCALLPDGPCPDHCRLIVFASSQQRRIDTRLANVHGVEISCSTLWLCKRYSCLTKDVLPVLDQDVWHILWSMHSSMAETQALLAMFNLTPRVIHPICGQIAEQARIVTLLDIHRPERDIYRRWQCSDADVCSRPSELSASALNEESVGSQLNASAALLKEVQAFFAPGPLAADTLAFLFANDDDDDALKQTYTHSPPCTPTLREAASTDIDTDIESDHNDDDSSDAFDMDTPLLHAGGQCKKRCREGP